VMGDGAVIISGTAFVTSANTKENGGTIFVLRGSLNIIGGTVENTASDGSGNAVYIYNNVNDYGTITISGGTVSATTGSAVCNQSTKAVTISGGTVSVTAAIGTGAAVRNQGTGAITISGGTVSLTGGGCAVDQQGTGTITISGGRVESTSTAVNGSGSAITISGGTVLARSSAVDCNRNSASVSVSGTATVTSTGDRSTISLGYPSNTFNMTGGRVENTGTGNAVSSSNSSGAIGIITISGGTISTTTGMAVHSNIGTITISGGTISTTTGKAVSNGTGIINLYGNPSITGVIFRNDTEAGILNVTGTPAFAPTVGKKYTLDYFSYPNNGTVIVTGGGNFQSYFELLDTTRSLAVSGSNLVIR